MSLPQDLTAPKGELEDRSRPLFILASKSPRRQDLLAQIGLIPDRILPADVDESIHPRERPIDASDRLATVKARAIAALCPGAIVLGADTIVARGRRVLPKPASEREARACLRLLSGARHRVHGGVCVIAPDGREHRRVATTIVAFKRLSDEETTAYLRSGEWQDKAGGYAIQGRAAAFIRQIIGSYSNVVGLPLFETAALLERFRLGAVGASPPNNWPTAHGD